MQVSKNDHGQCWARGIFSLCNNYATTCQCVCDSDNATNFRVLKIATSCVSTTRQRQRQRNATSCHIYYMEGPYPSWNVDRSTPKAALEDWQYILYLPSAALYFCLIWRILSLSFSSLSTAFSALSSSCFMFSPTYSVVTTGMLIYFIQINFWKIVTQKQAVQYMQFKSLKNIILILKIA